MKFDPIPALEILEPRIAPAGLIDGVMTAQNFTTATYTDVDGDIVTVKFDKTVFELSTAAVENAFTFTASGHGFSLTSLDLTKLGVSALALNGINLSITAEQAGEGDGLVNVGSIYAESHLGDVTVDGALAKISAGYGGYGIHKLVVDSLGLADGSKPADLNAVSSVITGNLDYLEVANNVNYASLQVVGYTQWYVPGTGYSSSYSTLGEVHVGGDIIGGDQEYSGSIRSVTEISSLKVDGSLLGGSGARSASVSAGGGIGSVEIGGDLIGSAVGAASITSTGHIQSLKVGGSISGGAEDSGSIRALGRILTAEVGGDLNGGAGLRSGSVVSSLGNMILTGHGAQNFGSGRLSGSYYGESVMLPSSADGSEAEVKGVQFEPDSSTVVFADSDGDLVTVKLSTGIYWADRVFQFSPNAGNGDFLSLDRIDISQAFGSAFFYKGMDISITADKSSTGDGLVNVGEILFTGIDLGSVFVDGSLGRIISGDNDGNVSGLKSLTIGSLGAFNGYTGDLQSTITGNLDTLSIAHDLNLAALLVKGSLGSATVGGSLVGGDLTGSGSIQVKGNISQITVGGDLFGGAADSATIQADGKIGRIVVNGDLIGGAGAGSAAIFAKQGIDLAQAHSLIGTSAGSATIKSDGTIGKATILGDIVGGAGERSGSVQSASAITSLVLGGSLHGGAGAKSGAVFAPQINTITAAGDLFGGTGADSGSIQADRIQTASVAGDLHGGAGTKSGSVISTLAAYQLTSHGAQSPGEGLWSGLYHGELPNLKIDGAYDGLTVLNATTAKYVDVDGDEVTVKFSKPILDPANVALDMFLSLVPEGAGYRLAGIDLSQLALSVDKLSGMSITVTSKSLNGGDGFANVGAILATGIDLGSVTVDGALAKVVAGDANLKTPGLKSLKIDSLGLADGAEPANFADVSSKIIGSVNSLQITHNIDKASFRVEGAGAKIGAVRVGGDFVGGANSFSGAIYSSGTIGAVTVAGDLQGGGGYASGGVYAEGKVTSVKVHSIIGGQNYASGSISARGIGSVTVETDIKGGTATLAGSVWSGGDIASVTIAGDLIGSSGSGSGSIVCDTTLKTLSLKGDLHGSSGNLSGGAFAASVKSVRVAGIDLYGSSGLGSGTIYSKAEGPKGFRVSGTWAEHPNNSQYFTGSAFGEYTPPPPKPKPAPSSNSGGDYYSGGSITVISIGAIPRPLTVEELGRTLMSYLHKPFTGLGYNYSVVGNLVFNG